MYQETFNSTLVYAKTLEVKTIRLILLRVFLDWKSISSPAYRIQKVPCTCYFYVEFFVIFCAFDYCLFLVEMAGARTLMPARKRRVACLSVRRLVESVCVCVCVYIFMAVNGRRRLSGGVASSKRVAGDVRRYDIEGPRSYLFVYLRVSRTDGAFRRGKLPDAVHPLAVSPYINFSNSGTLNSADWRQPDRIKPSNCKYCFVSDWLHPTDPSVRSLGHLSSAAHWAHMPTN